MRDRGPVAQEAGAGLDVVEVRGAREGARGDDVVGAELRGLEDEFQSRWRRGLGAQGGELVVD